MNQQNRSNESDEFQDEWLSAYLDDELSAPQRLIVEKRTATDASTQELLVDLQQIRQLIQELPPWTGQSTFDIAKFTSSKVSPSVLPTRDAVTRATDDNHRPTPSNMDSRQDESNSSLELPEVTAENSSIPFPAKELPRHLNEGLLPIDVEHIDHAENRETESTEDEEQYEAESFDAAQRDDQQLDGEQANAEGPAEVQNEQEQLEAPQLDEQPLTQQQLNDEQCELEGPAETQIEEEQIVASKLSEPQLDEQPLPQQQLNDEQCELEGTAETQTEEEKLVASKSSEPQLDEQPIEHQQLGAGKHCAEEPVEAQTESERRDARKLSEPQREEQQLDAERLDSEAADDVDQPENQPHSANLPSAPDPAKSQGDIKSLPAKPSASDVAADNDTSQASGLNPTKTIEPVQLQSTQVRATWMARRELWAVAAILVAMLGIGLSVQNIAPYYSVARLDDKQALQPSAETATATRDMEETQEPAVDPELLGRPTLADRQDDGLQNSGNRSPISRALEEPANRRTADPEAFAAQPVNEMLQPPPRDPQADTTYATRRDSAAQSLRTEAAPLPDAEAETSAADFDTSLAEMPIDPAEAQIADAAPQSQAPNMLGVRQQSGAAAATTADAKSAERVADEETKLAARMAQERPTANPNRLWFAPASGVIVIASRSLSDVDVSIGLQQVRSWAGMDAEEARSIVAGPEQELSPSLPTTQVDSVFLVDSNLSLLQQALAKLNPPTSRLADGIEDSPPQLAEIAPGGQAATDFLSIVYLGSRADVEALLDGLNEANSPIQATMLQRKAQDSLAPDDHAVLVLRAVDVR